MAINKTIPLMNKNRDIPDWRNLYDEIKNRYNRELPKDIIFQFELFYTLYIEKRKQFAFIINSLLEITEDEDIRNVYISLNKLFVEILDTNFKLSDLTINLLSNSIEVTNRKPYSKQIHHKLRVYNEKALI